APSDPVAPDAFVDTPGVVRDGIWYLPGEAAFGLGQAADHALAPFDACAWFSNSGCHGASDAVAVRDGSWSRMAIPGSSSAPPTTILYGDPGDTPLVGDWSGDGNDTPAVVRNGWWYLRDTFTTGVADRVIEYGDPGDIPVTGDWTGTGRSTPVVVRNGIWY